MDVLVLNPLAVLAQIDVGPADDADTLLADLFARGTRLLVEELPAVRGAVGSEATWAIARRLCRRMDCDLPHGGFSSCRFGSVLGGRLLSFQTMKCFFSN